ncbi:hypothetical protein pb186bvf_017261 [Paramecium bursaria]
MKMKIQSFQEDQTLIVPFALIMQQSMTKSRKAENNQKFSKSRKIQMIKLKSNLSSLVPPPPPKGVEIDVMNQEIMLFAYLNTYSSDQLKNVQDGFLEQARGLVMNADVGQMPRIMQTQVIEECLRMEYHDRIMIILGRYVDHIVASPPTDLPPYREIIDFVQMSSEDIQYFPIISQLSKIPLCVDHMMKTPEIFNSILNCGHPCRGKVLIRLVQHRAFNWSKYFSFNPKEVDMLFEMKPKEYLKFLLFLSHYHSKKLVKFIVERNSNIIDQLFKSGMTPQVEFYFNQLMNVVMPSD